MKNKNTFVSEIVGNTKSALDTLENTLIRTGLITKKVEIILLDKTPRKGSVPVLHVEGLEPNLTNAVDLRDLDNPIILNPNLRNMALESVNEAPYTREQLVYFAMRAPKTANTIREIRAWAQKQGIDLSYRQSRAVAKIRENLSERREYLLQVYQYFTGKNKYCP
jgi:hypothetical protein